MHCAFCIVLLYRYVYYYVLSVAHSLHIHNNLNSCLHTPSVPYYIRKFHCMFLHAVFVVMGQHKPWLNHTVRAYVTAGFSNLSLLATIFNNVPSREKWIYYVWTSEWVEFSHIEKYVTSGQRARHTRLLLVLTKHKRECKL